MEIIAFSLLNIEDEELRLMRRRLGSVLSQLGLVRVGDVVGSAKVALNIPAVGRDIRLWLVGLLLDAVIAEPSGCGRLVCRTPGLDVIAVSPKPSFRQSSPRRKGPLAAEWLRNRVPVFTDHRAPQ